MSHTETSYQSVDVKETTLAAVQNKLYQEMGTTLFPRQAVETALQRFLHLPSISQGTVAVESSAPASQAQDAGYRFIFDGWMIVLPNGTIGRIPYKGKHYSFEIKLNELFYNDEQMSASAFAKKIGGPGRSAKAYIEVKRPQDADFIPAKDLFAKEAVRAPREKSDEPKEDIPYLKVIDALDRLQELKFPEKLFRHIHHRKDTMAGFRKYARQGIDSGHGEAKTTSTSNNGRNYLRMAYLVDNYSGEKTDAAWLDLVNQAVREIPFKEAA